MINVDAILWLVASELSYQTKWQNGIWVFLILEMLGLILFAFLLIDKIQNFIKNNLK